MIAHNFGFQACAVLSGLSTRQMFLKNEILPNFIIDSIADWPI
jgi:ribonucleotide monophosphatase NagD (HAD superfamily)